MVLSSCFNLLSINVKVNFYNLASLIFQIVIPSKKINKSGLKYTEYITIVLKIILPWPAMFRVNDLSSLLHKTVDLFVEIRITLCYGIGLGMVISSTHWDNISHKWETYRCNLLCSLVVPNQIIFSNCLLKDQSKLRNKIKNKSIAVQLYARPINFLI